MQCIVTLVDRDLMVIGETNYDRKLLPGKISRTKHDEGHFFT